MQLWRSALKHTCYRVQLCSVLSAFVSFHELLLVHFWVIKSRRMGWAGHVACIGERRGVYRVLVGKPEGKRPLGKPRHRWEDNMKMDLQEVG